MTEQYTFTDLPDGRVCVTHGDTKIILPPPIVDSDALCFVADAIRYLRERLADERARADGLVNESAELFAASLRAEADKPQGFDSWKSAAIDERVKRVKAERAGRAEAERAERAEAELAAIRATQPVAWGVRLADADADAPWLTAAHALCSDCGIPHGHISGRLDGLRGRLAAMGEERDAERTRADGLAAELECAKAAARAFSQQTCDVLARVVAFEDGRLAHWQGRAERAEAELAAIRASEPVAWGLRKRDSGAPLWLASSEQFMRACMNEGEVVISLIPKPAAGGGA